MTLTDAATTGGRSRAQAAAQHARVAAGATEGRVTAFTAGLEASGKRPPDRSVPTRRPPAHPSRSHRARRCRVGHRRRLARAAQPPPGDRQCHLRRTRRPALARRGPPRRSPIDRRRRESPMTSPPTRIVDAHVHIWDPDRTDWYPYLSHPPPDGRRHAAGMFRRFHVSTYRAESACGTSKSSSTSPPPPVSPRSRRPSNSTAGPRPGWARRHRRRYATDGPMTEAVDLLDRQMAAPRFRGVRPMGANDGSVPEAGLLALQERNLVFEVMATLTSWPWPPPTWPPSGPDRRRRTHRLAPHRFRPGVDLGGPVSTHWPAWATTCCASSPAWPCPFSP